MKIVFISLMLLLFSTISSSQVVEEWVKHFNGVSNAGDEPTAMAVDNSGNVYITGRSIGVGSTVNPWDIVTIKYDSNGVEIWTATFGKDNQREEANDIKVDADGNVYITGYALDDLALTADFLTIKYDSNGDTVWVRKYNGPANGDDVALALAVDTISGSVFVTGSSKGILTITDVNYVTIAYEPNGEQFWVSSYDGPGNSTDYPTAMTFRPGEVLVTGSSRTTTSSQSADYLTIKYSASSGDTVWTRRYNSPANSFEEPQSITVDQSGNVYVTGIGSSGPFPTDRDYLTIKYSTEGNEIWVANYNNAASTDEAYSVAVDNSGNVYVTGMSAGFGADFATIKYNSSGVEQWVKRYHGGAPFSSNFDAARAITVDEMSNVYVTGASVLGGVSSNPADMLTIKYSSDGDSLWTARYNGPGNGGDGGSGIALDNFGNIYVMGTSIGIGTASDYTLVKYKQTTITGLDDKIGNIPIAYNLSNNYPNPFNPSTKIKYTVPAGAFRQFVSIKVFNLLGSLVSVLVNENKDTGEYEIEFNSANLPSGVYFYTFQAGSFIETKKMVLLK